MMIKPTKAKWDKDRQLTRLFFEDGRADVEAYHVVGAVEWPIGLNPGYAILSGQEQKSGVIWIFLEYPFWTIQTSGMDQPLWAFFKEAWAKYLCRYFYYSNVRDHQRYFRQILNEPLIRSHPVFIEAEYVRDSNEKVDSLVLEYQRLKKIKLDKEGGNDKIMPNIFNQMKQYVDGFVIDEETLPGVNALRCLIAGYERFPYQKPVLDEAVPESYV
jgi:hypothetical protein